jgi:hypothetical protein
VVEAGVAMIVVLCLAGWGAIYAGETLRRRPWMARLAFLIVAFYGVCGAGDLAKQVGVAAGLVGRSSYSYWRELDDGTPARFEIVNGVVVSVTDLNGKPFGDLKYKGDRAYNHTLGMNTATGHIGDSHGAKPNSYERAYRETQTYLFSMGSYSHPRLELWFHLEREPHMVGMWPKEKKEFAVLGMDGFAPPGTKVRPFPENVSLEQMGMDRLLITAPDSLRLAHLVTREISEIPLPAAPPIYGAAYAWTRNGNRSDSYIGVAFGTSLTVYDAHGQAVATLPYKHDVDRWGRIWLGVLNGADRFVLRYDPSDWIDRKTRQSTPSFVDLMDAKGNVITDNIVPPAPPEEMVPTWSEFFAWRLQSPVFFFGEMLYRRVGAAFGSERLRAALEKQFGDDFATTRQVGIIVVLLAVILSAVVFFWARRAQLPPREAWQWAAVTLGLGLAGLMIFWLAGGRPQTVRCQACGQRRRIDEEVCGCCGAPWPAIPSDETAIADPLAEPAAATS